MRKYNDIIDSHTYIIAIRSKTPIKGVKHGVNPSDDGIKTKDEQNHGARTPLFHAMANIDEIATRATE